MVGSSIRCPAIRAPKNCIRPDNLALSADAKSKKLLKFTSVVNKLSLFSQTRGKAVYLNILDRPPRVSRWQKSGENTHTLDVPLSATGTQEEGKKSDCKNIKQK